MNLLKFFLQIDNKKVYKIYPTWNKTHSFNFLDPVTLLFHIKSNTYKQTYIGFQNRATVSSKLTK